MCRTKENLKEKRMSWGDPSPRDRQAADAVLRSTVPSCLPNILLDSVLQAGCMYDSKCLTGLIQNPSVDVVGMRLSICPGSVDKHMEEMFLFIPADGRRSSEDTGSAPQA